MKPKVVTFTVLVEPRPAGPGDEPWDENSFGCAIEDAVDEFHARLGRHHLKLLDGHSGVLGDGPDKSMTLYVDLDPSRAWPSSHSFFAKERKPS